MRISRPIIQILRTIKADDNKSNSLLDTVIKYLYDVEKMSVTEIAAVLEISISNIYKTLRKK
jgi:DNA-binding MarR family transcriptional regulator